MTTKAIRKILGYVPIVDAAYVQHLIEKLESEAYEKGKRDAVLDENYIEVGNENTNTNTI